MTDTLRLLKFDPAVALLIMANNHLNIYLRAEFATVGTPTVVQDALTDVVITTHESTDENIYRQHTGQLTYRYNRIDVADVFGGMSLDLTPPTTVASVMNNITLASGLVITADDFENALISDSSFVLTAKSTSLRWVGETTVTLGETGTSLSLAEAFSNNILNGLIAPASVGELDEVFNNNVLNGLVAPSA
jgi:hypothetical protein